MSLRIILCHERSGCQVMSLIISCIIVRVTFSTFKLLFKHFYFFYSVLCFLILLSIHLILKEANSNIPPLIMMFVEVWGLWLYHLWSSGADHRFYLANLSRKGFSKTYYLQESQTPGLGY